MNALCFLLLAVPLFPEQHLTYELRSANEITVRWGTDENGKGGQTVVLDEPKKLLRSLTVTWLRPGVIEDAGYFRLRFGWMPNLLLVPGGRGTLACNAYGVMFGVEPEFWRELNAAVSAKVGRQVDLLKEAEANP